MQAAASAAATERTMPSRNPRTIMLAVTMLACAGAASGQNLALDWRFSHFSPATGAVFGEKSSVKVRCEWNAVIAATGHWDDAVDWEGMLLVDGTPIHLFEVKYQPKGGWFYRPG